MSWSALRHAINLSRQGKHAEAVAAIDALRSWARSDARACLQCALIQLEAGHADSALDSLQAAAALEPPPEERPAPWNHRAPLLLYQCLACGDLEQWDDAERLAEELQQVCPQHQFLDTLWCYLHLAQGRYEKALHQMKLDQPPTWFAWTRPELSPFSPLLSRLLVQVERLLLPIECPALQHSAAAKAPAETPAPPTQWSLNGLYKSVAGLFYQRKGIQLWEKALNQVDPDKRHLLMEAALTAQRKAVELEPMQFRGYYHLGETLLYASSHPHQPVPDHSRLAEAEECFLRSWALEGDNPYLYFYLGRAAQLQGKPEAAAAYLESALERFNKFPEAHYALGQIHLQMGQPQIGRDWLKRSISSDFLPVTRERLQELGHLWQSGKLHDAPPMPEWPPAQADAPAEDNDPTAPDSPPVENSPEPTLESTESHQSEDPTALPENRETSRVPPDPPPPEHLSSPTEPEPDSADPLH